MSMNQIHSYEDCETVQKALDLLDRLEGDKVHKDGNELLTSPYGLLLEQGHPAFTYNSLLAAEIGISLNPFLDLDSYKTVAKKRLHEDLKDLKRDLGDKVWEQLSLEARATLLDFKYNTGRTYSEFAQKAINYEVSPTKDNLIALVKESTRLFKGKRTEGLDNRSVSVLYEHGYIDSVQEARHLGLVFATDKAHAPWEEL